MGQLKQFFRDHAGTCSCSDPSPIHSKTEYEDGEVEEFTFCGDCEGVVS